MDVEPGMDVLTGAILGAVQGVTEFLPISSDGHLAIGAHLFGAVDMPLPFVVFLHVGTLLATFLVLYDDVRALALALWDGARSPGTYFETDAGKELGAILAATIPTGLLGLLLKGYVESVSNDLFVVAVCLLGSAALVLTTRFTAGGTKTVLAPLPAFFLGACQAFAVLPGLSRSATTIAIAMFLGLGPKAAFRFSFLLSLPAVAGAVLLECFDVGALDGFGAAALVGGVVAFFVGWASLKLLRGILDRGGFWVFALYLVPLALALLVWNGRA
jgi:undecaprenyl-diphosphatase